MPPLRALILDLGNVLVDSQPSALVQQMAEVAQVPVEAFTRAYWTHRPDIDRFGEPPRYWDSVLRDAGSPLEGAARDAARPQLGAIDGDSWSRFREEVWELAARFKDSGGRTAILSNCGPEVIDRVRAKREVARWFDAVIVSWELQVLKPEPAIYRAALERLGVEAGSALFVDDVAENVAGAQAVGMQALHFTGERAIPELRARLARPA